MIREGGTRRTRSNTDSRIASIVFMIGMRVNQWKHRFVASVTSSGRLARLIVIFCIGICNIESLANKLFFGATLRKKNSPTFSEQEEHTHRPQSRQWCLLLLHPNVFPQRIHPSAFSSGIQMAGTQCSTLDLCSLCQTGLEAFLSLEFDFLLRLESRSLPLAGSSWLSSSIPPLPLSIPILLNASSCIRTSLGANGKACSARRTCCVASLEVRVELGC